MWGIKRERIGIIGICGWGGMALQAGTSIANTRLFSYAREIDSAVLMIHGEKAHSCYMSQDAFKLLKGDNKELLIIPDAVHTDLYDGGFEQVGSIGQSIPKNDEQTTTKAGDIVLYSGNQVVVFYGSNSWPFFEKDVIKLLTSSR